MTPLEEQLEKLARRWEKEADEGELLDEVAYALEGAADELRALLPLEVTDESVTVTLSREEAKVLLMADHHVECDEKLEALQDSALDKLSAALTQKGDNE